MTEEKAHENRLRYRAQKAGLVLRRSPARREADPSRGKYRLYERSTRGKEHPVTEWLDLDGIEQELRRRS